ncbi:MAG: nitrate reductase molybdenum cofactor assembly chaperone [Acidobacteriaceae bacterium]
MTIYSGFAAILDYPEGSVTKLIDDCSAELATEAPEARAHLLDFQAAIAGKSLGQLQEVYAATFDLRPDCTPNLSYHVFGDDARRGVFLAEMKGRMEARGMALGTELPDHLSFILKYLDLVEEERPVVIEDCLLPAVARMIEVLKDSRNPYEHALRGLLSLLQRQREMFVAPAETVDA